MNSILSQVSQGPSNDGIRIVIAGAEKIGKTTLVCGAPQPLLIPLEVGYANVSIPKTPMIQNLDDFNSLIEELLYYASSNQFPCKSLIFDSVTGLEKLIHQNIIESDKAYFEGNPKGLIIDNVLGGYGRGHSKSNDVFIEILKKLDILAVTYKINIIFTAHIFASKLIDPIHGEYDSWDLLLHSPKNNKTYGKREIFTQWLDAIGFLYEPMYIAEGESMNKGVTSNKGRVLGLSRTPSYVAGNRFGINGEISIPIQQGWNSLADAIHKSSNIDVFNRN